MNESIKPPPFTKREIISRAEELFLGYADLVGHERAALGINFDVIFDKFIYPEYEIELVEDRDLGVDESGAKILGFFQPELNRVFVDRSLKYDPRRIFTCWHEVGGHAVLQGDWLRKEFNRIGMVRDIVTTESMLSTQVEHTLEWQANLFAAHASAPLGYVDYVIKNILKLAAPIRFSGPGGYCFDAYRNTQYRKISDFSELCICVARYIQHRFGGLSVESLSYRVAECNMVLDDTSRPSDPSSAFGLKRTTRDFKRRSSNQTVFDSNLISSSH